jgi:hypothetical protein
MPYRLKLRLHKQNPPSLVIEKSVSAKVDMVFVAAISIAGYESGNLSRMVLVLLDGNKTSIKINQNDDHIDQFFVGFGARQAMPQTERKGSKYLAYLRRRLLG